MSQVDYAKHRGISQPRVSVLISSKQIPDSCIKKIGKYNRIDRDLADAALEQNLDQIYNPKGKAKAKANPKPQPTQAEMETKAAAAKTNGMSLSDAQKIQAQYKAALMKLEFEEKSGKLTPTDQVKTTAFNQARIVRDSILNVPNRISAELASMTDVHLVSEKLTTELMAALEELSNEN